MYRASKAAALFLTGGTAYALLETAWRGHTHWTMFVLGGFLFLILGELNEGLLEWDTPLILQGMTIDNPAVSDYNKDVFLCNGGVCPWKI